MRSLQGVETCLYLSVTALACLALLSGVPDPPLALQVAALAFAVILFALPHGALDPLVARRTGIMALSGGFIAFHLAYGSVALTVLGIWLAAPGIPLAGFLAVSAYHFAGDWFQRGWALRLLLGGGVLGLPAIAHPEPTGSLYALLAGPSGIAVAQAQHDAAVLWLAILAAGVIMALFKRRGAAALELTMITASGLILPPLVFFGLHFCLLHSPRHILCHWSVETQSAALAATAALYTAIAVIAALMIAAFAAPLIASSSLSASGVPILESRAFQTLFIALAALTAPHLIVTGLAEGATGEHRRMRATPG